jgi:hypothetical protein
MIATLAFKCGCGVLYSLATFDDRGVTNESLPVKTIDEWLTEHLPHNIVQDGKATIELHLLGYAGKGKE